jgi:ketosteroid isomerase-like protein
MSQENVELVRRANALGNARHWEGLLGLVDPDIEWRDQMHAPDVPEVLHGIAELRRLMEQWEVAYETLTQEILEYIDADPWVICITRWHGEGKGSTTPVEVRSVDAFEVKDRMITRSFGGYPDLASARRAIGLAE